MSDRSNAPVIRSLRGLVRFYYLIILFCSEISGSKKLSGTALFGIVLGTLLGLANIGLGVYVFRKYYLKRRKAMKSSENPESIPYGSALWSGILGWVVTLNRDDAARTRQDSQLERGQEMTLRPEKSVN